GRDPPRRLPIPPPPNIDSRRERGREGRARPPRRRLSTSSAGHWARCAARASTGAARGRRAGHGRHSGYEPRSLRSEGIGIGHSSRLGVAKGRDSGGAIEPYIFVKLPRQAGLEIVAGKLALRPIDDTDRALEARRQELFAHGFPDW